MLWSHRDPDHGRTQEFSFEIIAALEFAQDRVILGFVGGNALDRLMYVGIEWAADGFDGFDAHLLQGFKQTLVNQFDAFGVIPIRGFDFDGAVEIVDDGQDLLHQIHGRKLQIFGALALHAAARVIEFGAGAQQAIVQIRLFNGKLIAFGGDGG